MSSSQLLAIPLIVPQGNVYFAQDKGGNHIAIKYVRGGSQEHKILQFIIDSDCAKDNCLIALFALLPEPKGDNWFAVMPRWDTSPGLRDRSGTVGGLLGYIESTLKALSFLHSRNIVHRVCSFLHTIMR